MIIFRLVCIIICTLEVLFISTADSLGVADDKFPPKFNYQSRSVRPEKKPNGRNSRSDTKEDFNSESNIDEQSMEQSKILEFIEKIRTNITDRTHWCNKSKEQSISLSNFTYMFAPSSFERYKNQTRAGLFIAKYLTFYLRHNRIDIQSFSDKHVSAIIPVLRTTLADDRNLAGGGIAFANNVFPYIFKSEDGTLQDWQDLGLVYKNYKHEEFFSIHNKSGYSELVSSQVTLNIDDAYYGQPYFDCFKHKRWIAAISLPFFGYGQTGSSVKFM